MKLLGLSMMAAVAVAQYCPGANPGPTSALDSNLGPVSMGDIDNTVLQLFLSSLHDLFLGRAVRGP